MTSIRVERVYPHPRSRVWLAITDRELLARWLMPNDFAPQVGHRFTFRTEPAPGFDGVVHCEVLEVREGERLVYSWRGGPIDTVLTFELRDDPAGTRLIMEQAGFRGVRAWIVARMLAIGSRTLYRKRLPAVLDQLAGAQAPAPPLISACMTREQSLLQHLLTLITRRPR